MQILACIYKNSTKIRLPLAHAIAISQSWSYVHLDSETHRIWMILNLGSALFSPFAVFCAPFFSSFFAASFVPSSICVPHEWRQHQQHVVVVEKQAVHLPKFHQRLSKPPLLWLRPATPSFSSLTKKRGRLQSPWHPCPEPCN